MNTAESENIPNLHPKMVTYHQAFNAYEMENHIDYMHTNRPSCPECGVPMIRVGFEDPESGWWLFWGCRCVATFDEDSQEVPAEDTDITVFSDITTQRLRALGIERSHNQGEE